MERLLSTQIKRRGFLIGTGALAASAIASRWSPTVAREPKFSAYPFSLGVASGDPLPNSVVLWTRLAPDPLNGGGMPPLNVPLQWQMAADKKMRKVVGRGTVLATPELAHSVRVVVNGLEPNRWYWYQFKAGSEISPIGRTRTVPALNSSIERLAFAFASCQNYEQGYYTAYRHMAKEDLDIVFHLGDYIYEGAAQNGHPRKHIGAEAVDLETYRLRYALYKTDPDLQAAHAAFPFICTWDDHEVANDYTNDLSPGLNDPAVFLQRRAAAYQAYYEHLPLRFASMPKGPNMQTYRRFTFGDLAEFSVLDTRQYRDRQACGNNGQVGGQIVTNCPELVAPTRTMLGAAQLKWLLDGIERSGVRWNVIAQQYLMAELKRLTKAGEAHMSDGWDGYAADRTRILRFIQERQTSNPVTLGGDIHSFWVTDLKPDFSSTKSPVVATEFVGTSISSGGIPYEQVIPVLADNPHIKFFESRLRGYVRCQVDRQQWTTDLRVVDTVEKPGAPVRTLATYVVESGRPGAQRV